MCGVNPETLGLPPWRKRSKYTKAYALMHPAREDGTKKLQGRLILVFQVRAIMTNAKEVRLMWKRWLERT